MNDPLQHGELHRRHRSAPPLPPQPLPALRIVPAPEPSADAGSEAQRLMADLEAARSELAALEDLLEQLPAIFETKFRRRLTTLLDQTRLLAEQNRQLREQLCTPPGPDHRWFRLLPGLPQREPRRAAQSRLGSPHT